VKLNKGNVILYGGYQNDSNSQSNKVVQYNTSSDTWPILSNLPNSLGTEQMRSTRINNSTALLKGGISIINKIHTIEGQCNVAQMAAFFSVSEQTIHRVFNKFVGVNPINYINWIKVRTFIQYSSSPDNHLLSVGIDAGNHDHSHFIIHFKSFILQTPSKFFEKNSLVKVSDFYNI
jgi:AraC-like DNA-binding protein